MGREKIKSDKDERMETWKTISRAPQKPIDRISKEENGRRTPKKTKAPI